MDPEQQADWIEVWQEAWAALDAQDHTNGLGGRQYMRLTARAMLAGIPACQAAMREWIMREANVVPSLTVTEESLARRERRRAENERKADDEH